jgi:hypothetical protein
VQDVGGKKTVEREIAASSPFQGFGIMGFLV